MNWAEGRGGRLKQVWRRNTNTERNDEQKKTSWLDDKGKALFLYSPEQLVVTGVAGVEHNL